MRVGIILQARMASQRLPRKAMAVVGGRPVVEQCLRRLAAPRVATVILATTMGPEDDVLAAAAERLNVPVFRGETDDVLGRYVACARAFELDLVIRATADNPGVDIDASGRLLDALARTGADYAREDGLPYGSAVEAVTTRALIRSAALDVSAGDREHVTTFVRRRPDLFQVVEVPAQPALRRPDIRITVDTWKDLQRIRELYAATAVEMPTLSDLIAVWDGVARRVA